METAEAQDAPQGAQEQSPPTQREPVSEQAPAKPKRRIRSTADDNAVRAKKKIHSLIERRAALKATFDARVSSLLTEEQQLILALPDNEREILFRLDPKLQPPPAPPGMASGPYNG